jgi:hypothetical protein
MARELATIRTPADLIGALRHRAGELDLSHLSLDALAGIPEGLSGKLFCGSKNFGHISLPALLDALGCSLVLIEDPARTEVARQARTRLGIGRRHGRYAVKVAAPARALNALEAWCALRTTAPSPAEAKRLVEAIIMG